MLLPANYAIYSTYVDYDDVTTHKFLTAIFFTRSRYSNRTAIYVSYKILLIIYY